MQTDMICRQVSPSPSYSTMYAPQQGHSTALCYTVCTGRAVIFQDSKWPARTGPMAGRPQPVRVCYSESKRGSHCNIRADRQLEQAACGGDWVDKYGTQPEPPGRSPRRTWACRGALCPCPSTSGNLGIASVLSQTGNRQPSRHLSPLPRVPGSRCKGWHSARLSGLARVLDFWSSCRRIERARGVFG